MRKLLLLFAIALCGSAVYAQSKISPSGLLAIGRMAMDGSRTDARAKITAIVRLSSASSDAAAAIEAAGGEVLARRGNLAIVSLPADKARAVASLPQVARMEFGTKATPVMNIARHASLVDSVQHGLKYKLDLNYSGEGVMLGMMDQGMDPNHITFYNDNLTANRITWMATITGTDANIKEYDTPEGIKRFTTDMQSSTHATHVAGIMAGSYNGKGKVAVEVSGTNKADVSTTTTNKYYGVAPQAEINPCVGDLYDANIMLAGETFLARAKAAGKPAAFNLSVGITSGPHDGTDLTSQYLSELGKEMIMCVSAGNDGDVPMSLQHTFSAEVPKVQTFLGSASSSWSQIVDTWGADATPFEISFAVANPENGAINWSFKVPDIPEGETYWLTSSNLTGEGYNHAAEFDRAFDSGSYIAFSREVNPENNRYNIQMLFQLKAKSGSTAAPVVVYSGAPGVKIDSYCYGSGLTFVSRGLAGYTEGNARGSINNFACASGVIAVGSYNSRENFPALGGNMLTVNPPFTPGLVSRFSSYGTLPTGRTLPDLCAPGALIVSSYSTYYVSAGSEGASSDICSASVNTSVNTLGGTRENYWGYLAGTSMSCPYVTGTAALLLEARPDLTTEQMRSLLSEQAMRQSAASADEKMQWGAGRLNALAAMRKLLGKPSSIGDVSADTDRRLAVNTLPGSLEVVLAGESGMTASLHSIAGAAVATAAASGEALTIDTSSLPAGIYVLTVTSPSGAKVNRKIVIK